MKDKSKKNKDKSQKKKNKKNEKEVTIMRNEDCILNEQLNRFNTKVDKAKKDISKILDNSKKDINKVLDNLNKDINKVLDNLNDDCLKLLDKINNPMLQLENNDNNYENRCESKESNYSNNIEETLYSVKCEVFDSTEDSKINILDNNDEIIEYIKHNSNLTDSELEKLNIEETTPEKTIKNISDLLRDTKKSLDEKKDIIDKLNSEITEIKNTDIIKNNLIKQLDEFPELKEELGIESSGETMLKKLLEKVSNLVFNLKSKDTITNEIIESMNQFTNKHEEYEKYQPKDKKETSKSMGNLLNAIGESLTNKDGEINLLKAKNENLEKAKSDLEKDVSNSNNSLKVLGRENDEINNMLKEKNKKIDSLEKELSDAKQEIKNLQGERNNEIENLKKSLEEKQKSLNIFDENTIDYINIAKLALKCPSIETIFKEEFEISNIEDMGNKVKFISEFGRGFDFARLVYNSMKKYKEQTRETITDDELELINAINDFYKRKYGETFESFDALDCLGMIENKEIRFDRKSMTVLNDARNTSLINAKKLYVPLLRMLNGTDIEKKAIIGE